MIFVRDPKFYKKSAGIALPIAAQSLITIGVNMMDTIMLGSSGEIALSASSLANQFITIYHVMCMGLGMGAAVLTARYWGMQDHHRLKKAVTLMVQAFFHCCSRLFTLFSLWSNCYSHISIEWTQVQYIPSLASRSTRQGCHPFP